MSMTLIQIKSLMVSSRLNGRPYGGLQVMADAMEREAFGLHRIMCQLTSDKVIENILEDIKEYEDE
ncbi:unnamed protein product [marine sediment metagenome]|uniref:Uncharacterized protein n=1 Tax=marine sediment metagenome TaxID=412755 RepID=X0YBA5_9ZZZZ